MDEIEYLGATSTILSYNLFTYCEGNPVIYGDGDGNSKELLINQVNADVFSRSGGNGVDDAVVIYAPKIPVASTTIIIQAKLIIIPVIKKIIENLKKPKEPKESTPKKERQIKIITEDNPPRIGRRSGIENLEDYRKNYNEGAIEQFSSFPRGAIQTAMGNYNFKIEMFNNGGYMGGELDHIFNREKFELWD